MSQKVRSRAPDGDDAFFYEHQEMMEGTTPKLTLKQQKSLIPCEPEGMKGVVDLRLSPAARTPAGFKEPNNTAKDLSHQKVIHAIGMKPDPKEGGNKQLIASNLAAMQRTQNSLGTNLNPQNLLDTNARIFSLRGDVQLFDPSTSKNQTK